MKGRILFATFLLISGTSFSAVEDIRNTPHNLSVFSDPNNGGTNEICVFCHTPHGANADFTGAPLWNKPIDTTVQFQVYGGGQTTAGTRVDQPGDTSRACLSCHDGASALNVVMNAPGSAYDPNGIYLNFKGDSSPKTMPLGFAIGHGYDLRDDHPVGVVYTAPNQDTDLNPASLKPTDTPLPMGWSYPGDKDGSGGPSIGDLLRNGKVECVSCHNPHIKGRSFLRSGIGNDNSNVCMTCHDK
ncbi:cytochrome c3 family protein [Persephonella sp.]